MVSIKTKAVLAVVAIVALSAPLIIQRSENMALRRELAELRAEIAELERLREQETEASAANSVELARLRLQQGELLRLRSEMTTLRQENQALRAPTGSISVSSTANRHQEPAESPELVPQELWTNIGFDTPERAFQSFLAIVKAGNSAEIASSVHFDVQWKEIVTEEDRRLVEKSVQEYLEMLDRARPQITAFNIGPVNQLAPDRQQISFTTATANGNLHSSALEMIRVENQWKPVLRMRWLGAGENATFATSPVFGPEIDLAPGPAFE